MDIDSLVKTNPQYTKLNDVCVVNFVGYPATRQGCKNECLALTQFPACQQAFFARTWNSAHTMENEKNNKKGTLWRETTLRALIGAGADFLEREIIQLNKTRA
jgi:hypothetical protein